MSIEAFQIASAVLGASTVGFGVIAIALNVRLVAAQGHVENLQKYVQDQCNREGALIRERDELLRFYNRTMAQRQKALRKAQDKNRATNEAKAAVKAQATVKTLSALQAAPLRPRDEVVANIRSSKAAQAVSSGG